MNSTKVSIVRQIKMTIKNKEDKADCFIIDNQNALVRMKGLKSWLKQT